MLEENAAFTRRMNPGVAIRWIAADNTDGKVSEKLDLYTFDVVPGADRYDPVPSWIIGSYRHARALHAILSRVHTRFTLILDSDFYIVRNGWVSEIISHMRNRGLAIFGVPWHPRHFTEFRYFPSHHTLFIDREKIDLRELNFLPAYNMGTKSFTNRLIHKSGKLWLFSKILRRFRIGKSRDTSYPVYRRLRRQVSWECPQAVFNPASDFREYPWITTSTNRFVERVLPDARCFIPKRPGYTVSSGFREAGRGDPRGFGWEEFMWRGHPYGFHVRGTHKISGDVERGVSNVREILCTFVAVE